MFDVIIVGYGPVGQALALMLGRQGRSVMVIERWTTRYALPRAVCIDHEIYRVLAANGMGPVLPGISHEAPKYQWFSAQWEELLSIDWSAQSISGGAEVNFVHQPTLEQALDEAVARVHNVKVLLGLQVIDLEQDDSCACVVVRDAQGTTRHHSARYVIGCDGANSLVREEIGGPREDLGFEADWLVIDVLLREGVSIEQLGIPAAGQYCNPARPTTIVPGGIRAGRIFRRWEFMRLPGERLEDLEREQRVWELLKPWAGPEEVELVRHKVYNFRSLLATQWRRRRLLIAGDAAHVMPPFMGQGMCSGLRDAWNLSWKLDLILDGRAREQLLDTYQSERRPHVRQLIELSIYLGKVICIPDARAAEERDRAFRDGTAPPPPPFPHLSAGLILHSAGSVHSEGAGLLSPHVMVEKTGWRGRLDELAGPGFIFFSRGPSVKSQVSHVWIGRLGRWGMHFVCLGEPTLDDCVADCDGRLQRFMDDRLWEHMIVRPDFYVYGGVRKGTEVASFIETFWRDCAAAGIAGLDALAASGAPQVPIQCR
jgi:2-polyprenyl-6-methoxyphenol hydroxylase-like FAD-dependent oxidoreductase